MQRLTTPRTVSDAIEDGPWKHCSQEEAVILRKKLKNAEFKFFICFKELEYYSLPEEIQQLTAGITQYLVDYHARLQQLYFLGNRYISTQQISILPAGVCKLTHLTVLNLEHNRLTTLPDQLSRLANLRLLYLNNNTFTTVPPSLYQLKNLRWLLLNKNQIHTLTEELGAWKQLQMLDLSDNYLAHIPIAIGNLKKLQFLFLENNALVTMPLSIHHLTNLEDLTLQSNKLKLLPHSVRFKDSLSINLSDNPWIQPNQGTPITINSLTEQAYQTIPRSLLTICGRYVTSHLTQHMPINQLIQTLPASITPESLAKSEQELGHLIQGKLLVYFQKIKDQLIPFYWEQAFYTKQEVSHMLKQLEGKQPYFFFY